MSLFLSVLVTVFWDHPGECDFRVYHSTNAALPVAQWTVAETTTNTFVQFDIQPGAYFFTVSASNFWGEVFAVETVSTPEPARGITKLQIRK